MTTRYDTSKREQRLMTATPEALETERASIQRFGDSLAVQRSMGLVDEGGVILERELIDWRVDTFNKILEQRPEVKLEAIDSFSLYAEAAEKAIDRQQAAEESFHRQSESQAEPMGELLAGQEKNIREEWLSDLQAGRLDRHALDSYFAGRIDQHNALIELATAAHPQLKETLPPLIHYGHIREELQQQIAHQTGIDKQATTYQFGIGA